MQKIPSYCLQAHLQRRSNGENTLPPGDLVAQCRNLNSTNLSTTYSNVASGIVECGVSINNATSRVVQVPGTDLGSSFLRACPCRSRHAHNRLAGSGSVCSFQYIHTWHITCHLADGTEPGSPSTSSNDFHISGWPGGSSGRWANTYQQQQGMVWKD